MRRIAIRNLRSPKPVKPRLFDLVMDGKDSYLEIKNKNNENDVVYIKDVFDQIVESDKPPPIRRYHRKKRGTA